MFAYIQNYHVIEVSSYGGHQLPGIKVDLGENPQGITLRCWYLEGVFYKSEQMPKEIHAIYPRKILSKYDFLKLFTDKEITDASKLRNSTLALWWLRYDSAPAFYFTDKTLLNPLVELDIISKTRKIKIMDTWPLS